MPRGGRTAKHDRPGVSFPSKEGVSIMTSNDLAAERAAFIAGLRDLADYLADRPGVPVPPGYHQTVIHVCATGEDEAGRLAAVGEAAAALGVPASGPGGNGHCTAVRAFGPVAYEVLAITDAGRAAYRAQDSYYGSVTLDGAAA